MGARALTKHGRGGAGAANTDRPLGTRAPDACARVFCCARVVQGATEKQGVDANVDWTRTAKRVIEEKKTHQKNRRHISRPLSFLLPLQWRPSRPTTPTGACAVLHTRPQSAAFANRRPKQRPTDAPHPSHIHRLLRHGRSKPNEAGIIVSKMVSVWEDRACVCVWESGVDPPSPHLPPPLLPGKRRQARVRPGRRRQGAGGGGRVNGREV